jgi:hypothetical protein
MTNTSPVPFRGGGTGGAYQGSTLVPDQPEVIPFNEAMNYLNEIRGKAFAPNASKNDRETYSNFVGNLRRYTDSELGTQGGVETAWKMVLEDAGASGVSAINLLTSGPSLAGKQTSGTGGDSGGSGRGGGYSGPTVSRTMQAESDIKATANALAIELIGRPVDDKELDRIVKRMRGAEMAQPQITTSTQASSTTQQGLTPQGREDILRDVISKNPEFVDYQLDTTVMDLMLEDIETGKQVARG